MRDPAALDWPMQISFYEWIFTVMFLPASLSCFLEFLWKKSLTYNYRFNLYNLCIATKLIKLFCLHCLHYIYVVNCSSKENLRLTNNTLPNRSETSENLKK